MSLIGSCIRFLSGVQDCPGHVGCTVINALNGMATVSRVIRNLSAGNLSDQSRQSPTSFINNPSTS